MLRNLRNLCSVTGVHRISFGKNSSPANPPTTSKIELTHPKPFPTEKNQLTEGNSNPATCPKMDSPPTSIAMIDSFRFISSIESECADPIAP
jgi:hypothetical protein